MMKSDRLRGKSKNYIDDPNVIWRSVYASYVPAN